MTVIFEFEGKERGCAFFALYAGLRMYMEVKETEIKAASMSDKSRRGAVSIAAAEAYCMLEELREQFPKLYKEAVVEYENNY